MARTANSARSWKVSFGCNLSTRRVRFLILKNRRTSMEPPSKDVVSIDVRQARRSQVQPGSGDHAVLDRHVLKMVVLEVCGGLDLDQTPSAVPAALKHIHAHEHAAVLESALEDRRNLWVRD